MPELKNIHPGEILKEEFLIPMGITPYKLSKETGISQTALSEITKGERRITAPVALKFAKFFGVSPRFWMGLQDDYDLEEEQIKLSAELDKIQTFNMVTPTP